MNLFEIIKKNASVMAALIGIIASLISAIILFTTGKLTSIKIGDLQIEAPSPPLSVAVPEKIEKELNSIKSQLSNITKLPKDVAITLGINNLRDKVKDLEKQINTINEAIMQSPEKALNIPMLRKDVNALKLQYENTTKSLEREIRSAYEIIKWVLGTILLGILGIAASVFIAVREKKNA